MGYVQSYDSNHGEKLSEGVLGYESRQAARKAFNDQLHDATRIIERNDVASVVPSTKSYLGAVGERVVLETPPNDVGHTSFAIIWYGGDDAIRVMEAPTLDLALEFEQYLIGIDFRSPM